MSTFDEVKELIAEQMRIDKSKITPEATFIEDLEADSLDTVEFVMAAEEKFGIEVSDEEASKIKTVSDVVDLIETKKKG